MKKKIVFYSAAFLILLTAGLLIGWSLGILQIESPEAYYENKDEGVPIGNVTLGIFCENALASDNLPDEIRDRLPQGGALLAECTMPLYQGDTVFSLLSRASRESEISFSFQGTEGSGVYIDGIGPLFEMDCGDLSGWIYTVNGKTVSKSADDAILSDNDRIQWVYSCNLGKDIS